MTQLSDIYGRFEAARLNGEGLILSAAEVARAAEHIAALELAAPRDAEIARLTALLAEAREERVDAAKRLSVQAARWLDDFIADSELIDAINGELDAALAKIGA